MVDLFVRSRSIATRSVRSVGLSVAHRKIGAFGGLLYGAAAVSHELITSGPDLNHGGQDSRLDVGDMTLLEADRRLSWEDLLSCL